MQAESIGFTFCLLRCCQDSHALLGLLEVLDAFVNFTQFLFQLVLVGLQAFLLLLGGEELAKSWTASAPTTAAGASHNAAGTYCWLTHTITPFQGFVLKDKDVQ